MMEMATRALIVGTGMSVPENVVTNDDLAKIVDTSHEWIFQRTGIAERRVCLETDSCSQLATKALEQALQNANLDAAELDVILVATVSGDHIFPATSCLVQNNLGAKNAAAMDLGAACAGFIFGSSMAASMIESGHAKTVGVVGVDTLTRFLDWSDRSTCVLFGDGAGAAIFQASQGGDRGLLETVMLSDGSGAKSIHMDAGGSKYPMGKPESLTQNPYIQMSGSEVYRFAVNAMGDACKRVLEKVNLAAEDIDLFVPHQANIRIIDSAAARLSLPEEKVFKNVDKYGNTSAGSVPIALHEAQSSGRLKPGDLVMTVGFGAGLVWGANLIRW